MAWAGRGREGGHDWERVRWGEAGRGVRSAKLGRVKPQKTK